MLYYNIISVIGLTLNAGLCAPDVYDILREETEYSPLGKYVFSVVKYNLSKYPAWNKI
jgi:hypothetical protein